MPTAPPSVARSPAWELTGLSARSATASLDLAAPGAGLTVSGGDHLLGLDLRAPRDDNRLIDHWVRGDDCVAVYEPADPRRLRATAMWRSLGGEPPAWELVVSAQTSLVESDSTIAVRCTLAAGDLLAGRYANGRIAWTTPGAGVFPPEATCLLVRRNERATLVAVHPADARRITARLGAGRVDVACWLFSAAIEKGVLLRSRVLAACGPAAETGWADALVAGFAASPPPLTT
ncbi:MAG: hypothetical protein ACKOCX_11215 [Planctomycetota bacterium]